MAIERSFNEQPSQMQRKPAQRPEDKAEQLREDIARTRSQLSDDMKAIGERLHPDQLKEDAKDIVHHAAGAAREGAKEMVRDAKDAAIGSLRHAKEQAFDSISAGVDEVSQRARVAGHAVSDFVATHAIPLTLLGAGAGWLLISLSHQRRLAAHYPDGGYYRDEGGAWQSTRERMSDLSDRASDLRTQVANRATKFGHEAAELSQRAYHGIERAGSRAVEVGERNPLMIGLFALAAGATVAMLLPATRRENQLLGQTRDRLVQRAHDTADQVKQSVQRGANDVREVIDEIRQPGSTHA